MKKFINCIVTSAIALTFAVGIAFAAETVLFNEQSGKTGRESSIEQTVPTEETVNPAFMRSL